MIRQLSMTLLLFIFSTNLFAQREKLDNVTDSIVNEGKALYRSEWASWYGTDVFLAKCAEKRSHSAGYLSYETDENLVNIFFSNDPDPKVLASITFGRDFNSNNYKLDTALRPLNKKELDLYRIRTIGLKRAISDTAFKHYNNTGLNVIPFIQNNIKKVYVLTSPKANGEVIFGNDYLIYFNDNNEITSVKPLHKGLINIKGKADTGKTVVSTIHTHLHQYSDFITATDICTLMLYEKFTTWKQHYVISKNDVSIWDCEKNILVILTMEAWKRIQNDQITRHPDKQ